MYPVTKTVQPFLILLGAAVIGLCMDVGSKPRQTMATAQPDFPPGTKFAKPIPFPDGVIDADLRTAYVSTAAGGIQAIRLEDGSVFWTNDDCQAQPWLAAGQRLIARGERLFVLDLKTGKLQRQCDAPVYPKVEVPERCTVSFQLWGPHVVGDTLEAKWFAVAHIDRSKGRPFAFKAWTAFNKSAPAGTAKFDLATGKVVVQTDAKPADVTAGLMPEAARPERRMPAGLPAKLAEIWQQYHKDQNGRITFHGERMVGVAMILEPVGKEYRKRIVLNAWNVKTGLAAEPVELVADKAINIANIVLTEDRRHAAVVFGTSALSIFSLADGKLVARDVKGVPSPEKAFVQGKRLYYTQVTGFGKAKTPQELKALDLDSGKLVWQRSLKPRSTIPLPP